MFLRFKPYNAQVEGTRWPSHFQYLGWQIVYNLLRSDKQRASEGKL